MAAVVVVVVAVRLDPLEVILGTNFKSLAWRPLHHDKVDLNRRRQWDIQMI